MLIFTIIWLTRYAENLNISCLTLLWLQGSKSVNILKYFPKVNLVHLKVKHCQTLRVVSTFTGQDESTDFDW